MTVHADPGKMTNLELDNMAILQDQFGPGFKRTNTNVLMAATFPPLKAIVPGYVYAGFVVLAGRMKLGKTWLAIDWAVAVATGGTAMGSIDCERGDVLYIDMENGPRRIQSRIRALFPQGQSLPDMSRLDWVTEAPQLDKGFIDRLERWRLSVKVPAFVVIDVLQRVKPAGNKTQNAYESDYSIWAPLQEWATRHGVAVLGLHHTKKGGADDPLEALSGSNGLSAVADTTIVLDQDQNGRTLYVRGRDVEEKETALLFAAGAWSIVGEAAEVRRSSERTKIIAAMGDHGQPMAPADIVAATGMASLNVRQLLFKMAKAEQVFKVGNGRYWTNPLPNTTNTDNAVTADDDEERTFQSGTLA
ncbi:AAA family ATPase [Bradyrhizobium sp. CB1717]|uniref:AAA family ATPase n=1 Tax=Bradyrhizobium sp. CB1717 TaxID=3039154 RepID=UPI0024B19650|nr:AAA family ATPase [Bradyrhizobium sp. CB1717]WFU28348.1 AAA family ATPase [Bradyrhizobium sp. CB1717]